MCIRDRNMGLAVASKNGQFKWQISSLPLIRFSESRCQIGAQNILNTIVQKLFLYSTYFLPKIAAIKNVYFFSPWFLDLRWAALDSQDSAFCSWEKKFSNKPRLDRYCQYCASKTDGVGSVLVKSKFRWPVILASSILPTAWRFNHSHASWFMIERNSNLFKWPPCSLYYVEV